MSMYNRSKVSLNEKNKKLNPSKEKKIKLPKSIESSNDTHSSL